MKAVTHDAYGGGMYGTEPGQPKKPVKPPASETQSANGPVEATKHTLLPQLLIFINFVVDLHVCLLQIWPKFNYTWSCENRRYWMKLKLARYIALEHEKDIVCVP
uniref:Uncharacterized protein n=1 Tax=Quercus lobata TaxID=97700 RepID=A0A7N2KT56_QUELO